MNTATFDTHQAVKEITNSGLNDTQAEVIVSTINSAMHQNFATKSEIMSLKTELKTDILEIKGELLLLKWMVGVIIAVEILPLLKLVFS